MFRSATARSTPPAPRAASGLRLLPESRRLRLERGAIEQARECVVRGELGEAGTFDERYAVGVLQRVAAGAAPVAHAVRSARCRVVAVAGRPPVRGRSR